MMNARVADANAVEIGDVLNDPNNFGRHQKLQFAFAAVCNVINAIHLVSSVFISAPVAYQCQQILLTSNDSSDTHSSFHSRYFNKSTEEMENASSYPSCLIRNTTLNSTGRCSSYTYDRGQFDETTFTEFDLACGKESLTTVSAVVYMGGLLVGAVAFGAFSDYAGRRTAVIAGIWLTGVAAFSVVFAPSMTIFIILRFFLGAACIGSLTSAFILLIEISPHKWHPIVSVVMSAGWCGGMLLLTLIAYCERNWRYMQLIFACLCIPLMISSYWVLDESPLWLQTRSQHEKIKKYVERMKKRNKLHHLNMEDIRFEGTVGESDEVSQEESWRNIFHSQTLLLNLLISCFVWFTLSMGYFGLTLNVGNLVGNIYVNNLISGLIEIPAYLLLLVTTKLGRKVPFIILMISGGTALTVSAFLIVYVTNKNLNWIVIAVNMSGKLLVTFCFELIAVWSSEMYPTTRRNIMLGQNSMCARIGGMLSPMIVDIPLYINTAFSSGLAPLVFGVSVIIGGILSIFLPETKKTPVPATVIEANQMTWKRAVKSPTEQDDASPTLENEKF